MNPGMNGSKSQSGFYAYNPSQVLMSSQGTGMKHSPSPANQYATSTQPQPKYYSYSNQFYPQQPTQYGNYTPMNNNTPHSQIYQSNIQSPYQSPVYGIHHSGYQNNSFK